MTTRATLGFIVVTVVLNAGLAFFKSLQPTPENVLSDFYAGKGRAEDMLMDPLILHSKRVAPLVIQEVERPDMPHRRYAIGFLGQASVREALPLLHRILTNSQEQDEFRADALEAIHLIEAPEGRRLATNYAAGTNFLGYVAGKIAEGAHVFGRRTYRQALTGHHE